MTAPATADNPNWLQHFTVDEYDELLAEHGSPARAKRTGRRGRKDAISRWPDLADWCRAPLAERPVHCPIGATSHQRDCVLAQRFYLCALAIYGRLTLDYPWLLVHPRRDLASRNGQVLGFGPRWLDIPAQEAEWIGYAPSVGRLSLQWACVRIALATGNPRWDAIDASHIEDLREQIIAVGNAPISTS